MDETKQGEAGAGGESGGRQITEQEVIGTYKGMLSDVNQMRRKIVELEQELSEHQ